MLFLRHETCDFETIIETAVNNQGVLII